MRRIQHTASMNRRLSWAGRPLLPSPPADAASAAPKRHQSCRGAGALPSYSPPSTLSLFHAIYHPLIILTTPPRGHTRFDSHLPMYQGRQLLRSANSTFAASTNVASRNRSLAVRLSVLATDNALERARSVTAVSAISLV